MDDIADAVLILFIHALAFCIAHLLDDHLLGVLCGDAAKIDRRQRLGDVVADGGGGIAAVGLGEADLGRFVLDLLDDEQQAIEVHFAGLGIDLGADFVLRTIARARRALDRILHRGDHHRLVDRLLARDGIGNLQKLEPVGADCPFGHVTVSCLSRVLVEFHPAIRCRRPSPGAR